MRLTLLGAGEIEQALDMHTAMEVNAQAFMALCRGQVQAPERLRLETPGGVGLVMPAALEGAPCLSVKIITIFPANPGLGLPTSQALLLLLDAANGTPLALMEAARLTALRTGAAAGLATRLLAHPQARVLALLGAGGMAWDQARGVLAARPIEEVRLYTPSGASALALAQRLHAAYPGLRARAVASPRQAVEGADIITCATTSHEPVFDPAWVEPGAHINGVGSFTPAMREVPAAGLKGLRVFVDSREAALAEAGELIEAVGQGALRKEDLLELGQALAGQAPGRLQEREITFFKSVGLAVQDAASAQAALERARALGLGRQVEL